MRNFTQLPNAAIDRMVELSAGAWRLYCYLLRCRNQQSGQCNPSAASSAKAIGLTPRHVFKLRRELGEAGWARFDDGAATFLLGVDSIGHDIPSVENDTPIENDPLSKMTPPSVKNDTEPLSKMTPPSVIFAPTYKEEQDERTRRKNKTKGTREGADAPRAKKTSRPKKSTNTEKQPVADKKGTKGKALAGRALKSPFHSHPAVVAYREITGYVQINAIQAELIVQATGAELDTVPADWSTFLRDLAAIGHKHIHNVAVMVAAFANYQQGKSVADALDTAWTNHKGDKSNGNGTRKSAGENFRDGLEWAFS